MNEEAGKCHRLESQPTAIEQVAMSVSQTAKIY